MRKTKLNAWGKSRLRKAMMKELKEVHPDSAEQAGELLDGLSKTESGAWSHKSVAGYQTKKLRENEKAIKKHRKAVADAIEAKKALKIAVPVVGVLALMLVIGLLAGFGGGFKGTVLVFLVLGVMALLSLGADAFTEIIEQGLLGWRSRLLEDVAQVPQRLKDRALRIMNANPGLSLRFVLVSLEPPSTEDDSREAFLVVGHGPHELLVEHWLKAEELQPSTNSADEDSAAFTFFPSWIPFLRKGVSQ